MKMLLFVSALAILICLAVVVIAVMVDRKRNTTPEERTNRKRFFLNDK